MGQDFSSFVRAHVRDLTIEWVQICVDRLAWLLWLAEIDGHDPGDEDRSES